MEQLWGELTPARAQSQPRTDAGFTLTLSAQNPASCDSPSGAGDFISSLLK